MFHVPFSVQDAFFSILLARLQLGVGFVFVLTFVGFGIWTRFPAPYRDDWDWLYTALTHPSWLRSLFEPHNEHLIAVPRLLVLLQYRIAGTSGTVVFLFALAAQLVAGWLFWREIRRRWAADPTTAAFAAGVVLVLLFFTYQLQSVVFLAAVVFPLVQAFTLLGIVCLLNASDPARRQWAWVAAAVAASVCATFSMSNGLAAAWVLAAVAWLQRRSAAVVGAFAATGVLLVILYVALTGEAFAPAVRTGATSTASSITAIATFFLSFFASGMVYGSGTGAILAGTALLVAGGWCLWRVATTRDAAPRLEHFAAGALLFALASAAMAAPARAEFGAVQVAQSRYATVTLVYWSALIVCALSRIHETSLWRRGRAVVMALAVGTSVVLLLVQVFVGLVWKAKSDNVGFAAVALAAGVDDEEWISTLHPLTSSVYATRDELEAAGETGLRHAAIGTRIDSSPVPVCGGPLEVVPAHPGPGWRITAPLQVDEGEGRIVDSHGVVVGLVRAAPLVDRANPSQLEVVAAVWESLRADRGSSRRWAGFAQPGEGPPYRAYVLDEAGAIRCRSE